MKKSRFNLPPFHDGVRKKPQFVAVKVAEDKVSVSFGVITRALGALAAVIEESHCSLGGRELQMAVAAHRGLCRALRLPLDYEWRDGAAVNARDAAILVKRSQTRMVHGSSYQGQDSDALGMDADERSRSRTRKASAARESRRSARGLEVAS